MKRFLCIPFVFYSLLLMSQSDSIAIINLSDLEQIVENQDLEEDLDLDNLYEELSYIAENPYNINKVSEQDFRDLNLLSEIQISSFFEYRNEFGPFISIYELQAIPNWNSLTIQRLLPFLTIKENIITNETINNLFSNGKHLLAIKWKYVLQERAGFIPEKSPEYLGDPNHIYMRYRYNFNNKLRWGLTAEKDAGETFFAGEKNYGFDYYTGFVHYYNPTSIIESISLGDYTLSMGQGLISHNAFGSGKSTEAVNIKKDGRAIRPYSSVNEVNYFRGIASQLKINRNFKLISLASFKKVDGTINQDTTFEDGFESFSSLIDDGYHRTESEIDKKNTIYQKTLGGVLKYESNRLQIGVNFIHHNFDKPFDANDQLYRKYVFNDDNLQNVSVDFSWRVRSSNIFGEYARSGNGGTALMIASQSSLHPKVDVTLAYRDYHRDYQVLNPNAFGESRNAVNERGLYMGTAIYVNRNFTLRAYHDSWHNPWVKFRIDSPSYGNESVLRVEYFKKRKHLFYVQYKNEYKSRNSTGSSQIRKITPTRTQRVRVHFNNKVTSDIELRNRVEVSRFSSDNTFSNGWMVYQDILFKPQNSNLSLTLRYAIFDTDDFDSRIYAYENDILYEFRIPFYQHQGTRFYVHSRYKVSRRLSVEARFDRTYLSNKESIGSGGEAIEGNTRNEIKAQIVYRFL